MAVICYDKDGKVLKNFTQWDTGQTIAFDGVDISSAPEVHYGVQNKTMAYTVNSVIENGMVKAAVPNEVLREHGLLTVWLHYNDGQGGQRTEARTGIYVLPKQKPADYEYDDDMGADGAIGNLDDLLTEDKQNLVGAINEVFGATEQLGSAMENVGGKLVVFRGNLPQTSGSTITVQVADLTPESGVKVGTSVVGNNGYLGTVTSLIGTNDSAVITAGGGRWSEIGYTDLGAMPAGANYNQYVATIRPEGLYHFSIGDYHHYMLQREVIDSSFMRNSYRFVLSIGDDGIANLETFINGNLCANLEVSGTGGLYSSTIENSLLPTGLVNRGYVDGRFDTANRPQLRIAAAAFAQYEGASLTMELVDVMPSDKLAVGDVLVGTNGSTATVTGINDDMVYTESRGQKYNLQAGSVFYVGLKDFTWGTGGVMSGGRLLTSFSAIQTAYQAGYSIQMDMISGSSDQYHEILPMTYVGQGRLMFDRTNTIDGGYLVNTHVELFQDGTITGRILQFAGPSGTS